MHSTRFSRPFEVSCHHQVLPQQPHRTAQLQSAPSVHNALEYCCKHATVTLLAATLVTGTQAPALALDGGSLRAVLRAPAEFYRSRQQSNGGAIFLRPIATSRSHLISAQASLTQGGPSAYAEALDNIRLAAMDCVVFDFEGSQRSGKHDLTTASSNQQEYKLGDPCKLRLVVKNATTLTKDASVVEEARLQMNQIIR